MVVASIAGWLESLVTNLVCWIKTALVLALNYFIEAVGALMAALAAVLPDMPEMPARPAAFDTAASWVAWAFPVGTVVAIVAFMVAAWVLWQAVAIALRWAKALGD